MKMKFNFNFTVDLGNILLGGLIGFIAYPLIYEDKKDVEKVAKKGAVKEVARTFFKKGND